MKLCRILNNVENITNYTPELAETEIENVCFDSRKASADCIFVCISGSLSDGHAYARSAYDRGCRFFVAEKPLSSLPTDANVFLCDNTRKALSIMSSNIFKNPSQKLHIIGVTGTKGKTTTALLIYNLLNNHGIKCGYIGSNGVDFGEYHYESTNTTPESYTIQYFMRKMVDDGVKVLAIEVSSQALYMNRVYGVKFNTCIYTNLSIDHIGGFEHPTFEHYKACKKMLFSDYSADKIIYNADDIYSNEMISDIPKNCKTVSYSITNNSDMRATNIKSFHRSGLLGTDFSFECDKHVYNSSLNAPGDFSVYNALAAIAACREYGLATHSLADNMGRINVKGRFEMVNVLPYATFIIDYAHNKLSLTSALETLRSYNPKRLICLFGSVGGRTVGRRAELGSVASKLADFCILTSDNPDSEDPNKIISDIASQFTEGSCEYIAIIDREKAIEYAVDMAKDGDIILLAGKGHEDYQLIAGKKEPFSERKILEKAGKKKMGIIV